MPIVSQDHRTTILEAFANLDRYNLLQPNQAVGKGVQARRRQWNVIAGGRAGQANLGWIGVGVAAGAVTGLIVGLQAPPVDVTGLLAWLDVPQITERVNLGLPLALALGPTGGYAAHLFRASGAYYQGMMQAIVNERRSLIRPEMVTGQVEVWIPKALLSWRSHEWRYREGRPYIWLQLPGGKRIENELKTTRDYLLLPNDLHRAKSAALYAQRNFNRMISDSAEDYADVDEGEDAGDSRLNELLPFLFAIAIVLGGILLVIMTL